MHFLLLFTVPILELDRDPFVSLPSIAASIEYCRHQCCCPYETRVGRSCVDGFRIRDGRRRVGDVDMEGKGSTLE